MSPAWAPNGKEVYYRNGDSMMVVEVGFEPTVSAAKPRQLFVGSYLQCGNPRSYDLSPDGTSFVMIESEGAAPAELQLVLNWFQELRRLAPTE